MADQYIDLPVEGGGGGGSGITSINGDTTAAQLVVAASSGSNFTVATSGGVTTLALPTASASNRGALASADWTTFNNKLSGTLTSAHFFVGNGSNIATSVAMSGDISLSNTGATSLVATTNNTLTTLSVLSLPYSQVSGAPAAITALTGDGVASGPGSAALTLATVNSNVGSFGSSTSIPSFTVNAKGLVTAASGNAVIAPAGTLTGTTLASNVVTSSLTTVGTLGSLAVTAGVTAASLALNGATLGSETLSIKMSAANSVGAGFQLYANDGSHYMQMAAYNTGDFFLYNGSNQWTFLQAAGAFGVGNVAPTMGLQRLFADSNTNILAPTLQGSTLGVQNTDTTVNNYGLIGFTNQGGKLTSYIAGVNESHSSSTQTGHMSFLTVSSGTSAEVFRLTKDKNTVTLGGVSNLNYDTSTATSGTITTSANKPGLLITGAGGTTLTILLPPSPIDGQRYWTASQGAFTTVTWQDSGGTAGNVIGGQASLGGTNRGQEFMYSNAQTKWFSIS